MTYDDFVHNIRLQVLVLIMSGWCFYVFWTQSGKQPKLQMFFF